MVIIYMICTGKIKNARNDWLGNKGAMTAAGGEPMSHGEPWWAWIFRENRSGTNMISILKIGKYS